MGRPAKTKLVTRGVQEATLFWTLLYVMHEIAPDAVNAIRTVVPTYRLASAAKASSTDLEDQITNWLRSLGFYGRALNTWFVSAFNLVNALECSPSVTVQQLLEHELRLAKNREKRFPVVFEVGTEFTPQGAMTRSDLDAEARAFRRSRGLSKTRAAGDIASGKEQFLAKRVPMSRSSEHFERDIVWAAMSLLGVATLDVLATKSGRSLETVREAVSAVLRRLEIARPPGRPRRARRPKTVH